MLALLGTLITGVISGGATGLLGVALQRYFDFLNRKQDLEVLKLHHEQAQALARIESERAQRRAEADERIADRQAEAEEGVAYARAMVASYEHDQARYVAPGAQTRKGLVGGAVTLAMALVDFTRGMIRPIMTVYLMLVVTIMFNTVHRELVDAGHGLTAQDKIALLAQITATILYCATTCVVWWFGARPPKRQGDR